jgi:hypothetical protein
MIKILLSDNFTILITIKVALGNNCTGLLCNHKCTIHNKMRVYIKFATNFPYIDRCSFSFSHIIRLPVVSLNTHKPVCMYIWRILAYTITIKLLDFVHRPDFYKQKTQRFGNRSSFRNVVFSVCRIPDDGQSAEA